MGVTETTAAPTGDAATPSAPAIEPHLLQQDRPRLRLPPADPAPSPENTTTADDAANAPAAPDAQAASDQDTATTTEPAKPSDYDEKFQLLLKRSKALRDKEAAIKQAEAELEEARKLKERLKSRDYSLVQEFGGSIEDWSARWLEENGEKPDPVRKELIETKQRLAELAEWKQQFESQVQTKEEQEAKRQQEQAVAAFRQDIDKTLAEKDEHKMLHVAGLGHEVFNVIAKHAERTKEEFGAPQVLSIDEAAGYVKNYYVPKLKETVKGLLGLPDFKDVLAELTKVQSTDSGNGPAKAEGAPPKQETEGQRARPAPATLLPEHAASAPPRSEQRLTREERMQAAKAVLRFG